MVELRKRSAGESQREKCYYDAERFALAGDAIDPALKFHWFITAHFGNRNKVDAHRNCKHFRNVIDRKILGEDQRLYKMLWLEEGSSKIQLTTHAHWIFEQPANLSEEAFKHIFCFYWTKFCGDTNIDIRPIRAESGGIEGIFNYCAKEALNGNIGVFSEVCSDNARRQADRHTFIHRSLL